jgi:hypothetical protein
MLPNIVLQSGEPVAVELTYTPAAAEVVYPCEGNLALAVESRSILGNGNFTEPAITLSRESSDLLFSGESLEHAGQWYMIETVYPQAWSLEYGRAHATYTDEGPMTLNLLQVVGELDSVGSLTFRAGANPAADVQVLCLEPGNVETPLVNIAQAVQAGENTVPINFAREGGFIFGIVFRLDNDPGASVSIEHAALSGAEDDSLIISALQTPARGTRVPTAPGILYNGPVPTDMILIPLDPAVYGLGAAPQRVGLLEFTGAGAPDIRAAIVRWRDPS